jgi:hypothetical protein
MRKFAFLPGALMVVAAFLWAAFTLRWTVPAAVLSGGGLLALAVGVAANWEGVREWFRDPRGVFALNTALSTLLLVAALVLVNALVGLRGVAFDWTEAGRNTLAPETVSLVEGLEADVVLKQMGRPRDIASRDLLGAFSAQSPRVRVEVVDIDASPAEAAATASGELEASWWRWSRFRLIEAVTGPRWPRPSCRSGMRWNPGCVSRQGKGGTASPTPDHRDCPGWCRR